MTTVHDLLSAEDCALKAKTEVDIQRGMNLLLSGCASVGLTTSANKTVAMRQPPPNAEYGASGIHANDTELKTAYLGSKLSRCIKIDDQVAHRISEVSKDFGGCRIPYGTPTASPQHRIEDVQSGDLDDAAVRCRGLESQR
ncbi:hypothetical protein SprV_0802579000 [Sparganum proliferum]